MKNIMTTWQKKTSYIMILNEFWASEILLNRFDDEIGRKQKNLWKTAWLKPWTVLTGWQTNKNGNWQGNTDKIGPTLNVDIVLSIPVHPIFGPKTSSHVVLIPCWHAPLPTYCPIAFLACQIMDSFTDYLKQWFLGFLPIKIWCYCHLYVV